MKTIKFGRAASTLVLLLVVGLIVTSFVLGRLFRAPGWTDEEEAARPIDVWSTVSVEELSEQHSAAGVVKQASEVAYALPLPSDGPTVLGVMGQKQGETLTKGFVAEVSGQPHFLLTGPLPLYRNIKRGMSGIDVKYLQVALTDAGFSVPITGTAGELTLAAAARMFDKAGYRTPRTPDGEVEIPYLQLHPMPPSGIIVKTAKIGTILDGDVPLMTIRIGHDYLEFVADVELADLLKPGSIVKVDGPRNRTLSATVTTIGEFKQGNDGSPPGRIARAELDEGALAQEGLVANSPVTVRLVGRVQKGPSVPIIALRGTPEAPFVILKSDSGPVQVPVTVMLSSNGRAVISGTVTSGDEVLIS